MGLTNQQPWEFIGIKQEVMVYKYLIPFEYDVLQGAQVC